MTKEFHETPCMTNNYCQTVLHFIPTVSRLAFRNFSSKRVKPSLLAYIYIYKILQLCISIAKCRRWLTALFLLFSWQGLHWTYPILANSQIYTGIIKVNISQRPWYWLKHHKKRCGCTCHKVLGVQVFLKIKGAKNKISSVNRVLSFCYQQLPILHYPTLGRAEYHWIIAQVLVLGKPIVFPVGNMI